MPIRDQRERARRSVAVAAAPLVAVAAALGDADQARALLQQLELLNRVLQVPTSLDVRGTRDEVSDSAIGSRRNRHQRFA
jgi:hypothetical protein